MSFEPRRPDFNLRAMQETTDEQGVVHRRSARVGVAWKREDGSLLVKLEVGVALRWDDGLVLGLFDNDGKYARKDE